MKRFEKFRRWLASLPENPKEPRLRGREEIELEVRRRERRAREGR